MLHAPPHQPPACPACLTSPLPALPACLPTPHGQPAAPGLGRRGRAPHAATRDVGGGAHARGAGCPHARADRLDLWIRVALQACLHDRGWLGTCWICGLQCGVLQHLLCVRGLGGRARQGKEVGGHVCSRQHCPHEKHSGCIHLFNVQWMVQCNACNCHSLPPVPSSSTGWASLTGEAWQGAGLLGHMQGKLLPVREAGCTLPAGLLHEGAHACGMHGAASRSRSTMHHFARMRRNRYTDSVTVCFCASDGDGWASASSKCQFWLGQSVGGNGLAATASPVRGQGISPPAAAAAGSCAPNSALPPFHLPGCAAYWFGGSTGFVTVYT